MDALAFELHMENSKRVINASSDLAELKEVALALLKLSGEQHQALRRLMKQTFFLEFSAEEDDAS